MHGRNRDILGVVEKPALLILVCENAKCHVQLVIWAIEILLGTGLVASMARRTDPICHCLLTEWISKYNFSINPKVFNALITSPPPLRLNPPNLLLSALSIFKSYFREGESQLATILTSFSINLDESNNTYLSHHGPPIFPQEWSCLVASSSWSLPMLWSFLSSDS